MAARVSLLIAEFSAFPIVGGERRERLADVRIMVSL